MAQAPFLWEGQEHAFYAFDLCNVSVSQCFNCEALSLWIYDRLVYPRVGEAPPPNPDLSEEIRRDYDEAGSISTSPLAVRPRYCDWLSRSSVSSWGTRARTSTMTSQRWLRPGLSRRFSRPSIPSVSSATTLFILVRSTCVMIALLRRSCLTF